MSALPANDSRPVDEASSAQPAAPLAGSFASADTFLEAFTEAVGGLISYVDSAGRLRYVSNALADWLGAKPGELLGKSLPEVYGEETYEQFVVWTRRALAGEDGRACVREVDTVARLGGDEFVVLLETDVRPDTPGIIGERIRAAFGTPFEYKGAEVNCGASVGVSLYPDHARDPASLMESADEAMYRVKNSV